MGWDKREPVTDLVVLGDDEGNRKRVGGLLIGLPRDKGYNKTNYEIIEQSGELITLSGSASIARQLDEQDVGKFVKLEFTGWGKSPNGKYKAIEVNVWDGEPSDVMKKWPRFAEFYGKTNGKPLVASRPAVASDPIFDDTDFPGALEEKEDDLPF